MLHRWHEHNTTSEAQRQLHLQNLAWLLQSLSKVICAFISIIFGGRTSRRFVWALHTDTTKSFIMVITRCRYSSAILLQWDILHRQWGTILKTTASKFLKIAVAFTVCESMLLCTAQVFSFSQIQMWSEKNSFSSFLI